MTAPAPPRRKISDRTLLASTLCIIFDIPHEHQILMHEDQVLSLIERDHYPIRHADGGSNHFSNVRPLLIAAHDFKTFKNNGTGRSDATDMAHDRALIERQHQHGERMAAKLYGESKPEPERRARKLTGRGLGKGYRPMRSRNGFQGRQS